MNSFFTGEAPIESRRFWRICLGLCLLGLALRLPTLASRSLWLDETYSAWFSALSLNELWTSVPLYETHPPMYYTLLKGWSTLFGAGEVALRCMSVLASVATILLLAISGRALRAGARGDRVALLAALFLAFNRGSIEYAQQARPYALETLFATFAILFSLVLLRRLDGTDGRARTWPTLWPYMLGLGISAGATLWLHNTATFIILGIWSGLTLSLLLFVKGGRGRQVLAIGLPAVLALLIWSPFVPMLIMESRNLSKMSYWILFSPRDLISAWYLAAGGYPVVVVGLLSIAGWLALWRVERPAALHMLVVLLLPLTLVLGYSYFAKPIYISRLFEWLAPPVMALAALGVFAGVRLPTRRIGVTALVLALAVASTLKFYVKQTEPWRELVNTLEAHLQTGDGIIALPNEVNVAIHYYAPPHRLFPEVHYIPAPFPALGRDYKYIGNLGSPAIIPVDAMQVRAVMAQHGRIWLVTRNSGLYDPKNVVLSELMLTHRRIGSFGTDEVVMDLFDKVDAARPAEKLSHMP